MTASVVDILVPRVETRPSNSVKGPAAVDAADEPFSEQFGEALNRAQPKDSPARAAQNATPTARTSHSDNPDETVHAGDLPGPKQDSDQPAEGRDKAAFVTTLLTITGTLEPSSKQLHTTGTRTVETEAQDEDDVGPSSTNAHQPGFPVSGHPDPSPTNIRHPEATQGPADDTSVAAASGTTSAGLPERGRITAEATRTAVRDDANSTPPAVTVRAALGTRLTGGASKQLAVTTQGDLILSDGQQPSLDAAPTVSLTIETEVESQSTVQSAESKTSDQANGGDETAGPVFRQNRVHPGSASDDQQHVLDDPASSLDRNAFDRSNQPLTSALSHLMPGLAATATAQAKTAHPVTGQVANAVAQELRVQWEPGEQVRAISLRLDPPELGALRIDVRSTADGLQMRVAVAEDVTLEMLTTRVPEIEQLLKHQDMNVHRVTIQRLESEAEGSTSFDHQSHDSPERHLWGQDDRRRQRESRDQHPQVTPPRDPTSSLSKRHSRIGIRA